MRRGGWSWRRGKLNGGVERPPHLLASPDDLVTSDEHPHTVADMRNLEYRTSALILMMIVVARGRIGVLFTARGNTDIDIVAVIENSDEGRGRSNM